MWSSRPRLRTVLGTAEGGCATLLGRQLYCRPVGSSQNGGGSATATPTFALLAHQASPLGTVTAAPRWSAET
jgi:hypothetical protein